MSERIGDSSDGNSPQVERLLEAFGDNELFDVLGNRRRRYILWALYSCPTPMESRRLAEQIAAWETDSEPDQVATSKYQSVYNSLYQSHLPQLERIGLVEYDRSNNIVTPTSKIEEVAPFMNSTALTVTTRLFGSLRRVIDHIL